MRRLRLLTVGLTVWLLALFSIERISAPINISRVAYPFIPLMAALVLLVPGLSALPVWVLIVVPVPVFLVLKSWAGYSLGGASLPITITEVAAILVTILLARKISQGLTEFEDAVHQITLGPNELLPEEMHAGEANLYREVRRARHHNRPLALLAVGMDPATQSAALSRILAETQEAILQRAMASSVARTLSKELDDYNLVVYGGDHFLVLLPEMTAERVNRLEECLAAAAQDQLGMKLNFGAAFFPQDAVTYESLVAKARQEMAQSSELDKA